jgi:CheY-like chemotaxis protein
MQTIERIYIIDDDKVVLHIFDRLVKKQGLLGIVEAFIDSEEALEKISFEMESKSDLPDLILIDINMPRVDGWDFIEALDKIDKDHGIPIIIISSSIDTADVEKSKTYKYVIDFIPKPLSIDKLDYIVERYNSLEKVYKNP